LKSKLPAGISCLFVIVLAAGLGYAEQNSETNKRLARMLKRFPAADADGDGVLTLSEARDFLKSRKGQQANSASQKPSNKNQKNSNTSFKNIKYGPHERNVLDFYKAPSSTPTPLVVYFHGGGFVSGDKNWVGKDVIKTCHENGVSVAAVNYRFINQAPLQSIMRDAARGIQFLRYYADKYNIDKGRVASYGGSAGGGISFWLGFHDDLADAKSNDPVLRESSRLTAICSITGQYTYDFARWPKLLGKSPKESDNNGGYYYYYWLKGPEEVDSPKGKKIRADMDMYAMVDEGDSPVFLYSDRQIGLNKMRNYDDYIHHPKHHLVIKQRCGEVGLECENFNFGKPPVGRAAAHQEMLKFFFGYFKIGTASAVKPKLPSGHRRQGG
jgi:acetyl esterase